MKPYELTYIISSEMTSEQAELESKNIESFVKDKGGIVLKLEKISPKTLAYPIKKQSSGFFGVLEFQLEPEYLGELQKKIQRNDNIIRHMIIVNNPAKIQKEKSPASAKSFDEAKKKEKRNEDIENAINEIKEKDKKISKKVELKEVEKKLEEILN